MKRNVIKRGAMALGVLGLLATPLLSGPAVAAKSPAALAGGKAGVVCATTQKAVGALTNKAGARQHRGELHDHTPQSPAKIAEVNRAVRAAERSVAAGRYASRLPATVVIPVHVVTIFGTHTNESIVGPKHISNLLAAMNKHFAGNEVAGSVATRFRFKLYSLRSYRNDSWFHANPDGSVDRYYRAKFRRGGATALNIYTGFQGGSDLLGYATFPWDYRAAPKRDGVFLNHKSLPGVTGSYAGYNQGDTGTHEVGHWLGLFHAFSDYNDCRDRDGVADTTIQKVNTGCPRYPDTCYRHPGKDQPWNYMQYTADSCMRSFSQGQRNRMDAAWAKWRG